MAKTGNRLSDKQISEIMEKVDLDKNRMVKNIKILLVPKKQFKKMLYFFI